MCNNALEGAKSYEYSPDHDDWADPRTLLYIIHYSLTSLWTTTAGRKLLINGA